MRPFLDEFLKLAKVESQLDKPVEHHLRKAGSISQSSFACCWWERACVLHELGTVDTLLLFSLFVTCSAELRNGSPGAMEKPLASRCTMSPGWPTRASSTSWIIAVRT